MEGGQIDALAQEEETGGGSIVRPICFLSEAGKLFKRVLAERLRDYLEQSIIGSVWF